MVYQVAIVFPHIYLLFLSSCTIWQWTAIAAIRSRLPENVNFRDDRNPFPAIGNLFYASVHVFYPISFRLNIMYIKSPRERQGCRERRVVLFRLLIAKPLIIFGSAGSLAGICVRLDAPAASSKCEGYLIDSCDDETICSSFLKSDVQFRCCPNWMSSHRRESPFQGICVASGLNMPASNQLSLFRA